MGKFKYKKNYTVDFDRTLQIINLDGKIDISKIDMIKIAKFFLDSAWGCIEGNKKDFKNSIKYISLTIFNPFEFIYVFFDSLSVNIIHSDKKRDIIAHRKENQLLGLDPQLNEEKEAYLYWIKILTMKRNYLLASNNKNNSAEVVNQKWILWVQVVEKLI